MYMAMKNFSTAQGTRGEILATPALAVCGKKIFPKFWLSILANKLLKIKDLAQNGVKMAKNKSFLFNTLRTDYWQY